MPTILANLSLSNPMGFWALLGIPAVILIHFLQRQARVVTISTLFLLEQTQRESLSGRRFERLRSSIPLWLQLLAVIALTWVLVGPRWLRSDSAQRIAVVLDSSSSMMVFKEELINGLESELSKLENSATTTEFILLDSDLQKKTIYSGTDLEKALDAVRIWRPRAPAHDFGRPLRVARSLAGPKGLIILATDHPPGENLPFEARHLAIGRPKQNCGLTGLTLETIDEQLLWKALLRNYSGEKQSRTWHVEWANKKTKPISVTLSPNQILPIQDAFPEDADAVTLVLSGDGFALDDRMPIRRDEVKDVKIWSDGSERFRPVIGRILNTFDGIEQVPDAANADIVFTAYDPLDPKVPSKPAFIFMDHKGRAAARLSEQIFLERHPLIDGLNWQGLICQDGISMPLKESDTLLVWQGERPLIILRQKDDLSQILFNFDITSSNADRLPAFVVMFHRFLETIRNAKVALESHNLETSQPIAFSFDPRPDAGNLTMITTNTEGEEKTIDLSRSEAFALRTPDEPGFIEIRQGASALLRAALHFADSREADLSKAGSSSNLDGIDGAMVTVHSEEDNYWRWWIVILGLLLIASWHFVRRRERNEVVTETPSPKPAPIPSTIKPATPSNPSGA